MKNLIDEVAKQRRVIKHDSIAFTLNELVEMHRRNEIIIRPQFQRLFRWTRDQQSNFIESLILEIPIPPLFFYENDDGVWELLDGLQRLSTLIRFFTPSEIPEVAIGVAGNEDDWHYENANSLDHTLQLLEGEYLKELKGMTMSLLPSQLQLNLKRLRQQIIVLKRETDSLYKYEIFKRLNKGGSQIEEQELRNCSVRILSDTFPDFLQEMARNEDFINSLGLSDGDLRNGYIEELVLRFYAVKNRSVAFKHDVDEFLSNYMEEVARGAIQFNYAEERALFERIWRCINAAVPGGEGFRSKSTGGASIGPFSPAIFELLTSGFAANIDGLEGQQPEVLKQKIIQLIIEAKAGALTGAGSNSKLKFNNRLTFGRDNLRP